MNGERKKKCKCCLEELLKQLEYVCACKPNKDWTPIRGWNDKLRARVGCEIYDLFIGRKAGGDSRFGVTFAGLEREMVEQLKLCLKEYLQYVKEKKGED